MLTLKYNGWKIISFIPEDEAKGFFDLIISNQHNKVSTLKEKPRSSVVLFRHQENQFILKTPIEKNRNKWIRFTTLYRRGEAFKCLLSMRKLEELNIPTPKPILAAEKRIMGMVVDSWLIYEFVPGEHCLNKVDQYPEVVSMLSQLHDRHYLHNDPQIRNFILGPEGNIYMIDSKLKPIHFSFNSRNYEWAYLAKSAPGIEKYFPVKNSFWFKVAKEKDVYSRRMVRGKRKVFNLITSLFSKMKN